MKGIHTGKAEVKLSLFANNMTDYMHTHTKLGLINEVSTVVEYKITLENQ